MSGVLNNGTSSGVPGGLWGTNSQGVASPQAGRPAMTGGLQPLAMLQAYRAGLPLNQLQAANPYTARPTQFLPQALPTFDYAAQYRAAQPTQGAPVPAQIAAGYGGGGGPGGGDGSVGSVSSDGGQDGSSAAAGGGGGGGGK
jgi:hypothetical protein